MPKIKDASGKWKQNLGLIPTRAPKAMWDYLKYVAKSPALGVDTLQLFLSLAAVEFLTTKPWERGLKLRQAEAMGDAPRMSPRIPNGVSQTNITLCPVVLPDGRRVAGIELRAMFECAAECLQDSGAAAFRANGGAGKVSVSSLAYTFLYWLAVIKYPPGAQLTYMYRFPAAGAAKTETERAAC